MEKIRKVRKKIKNYTYRVDIQVSILSCLLVVASCLGVFAFNYAITYQSMIEELSKRTKNVYEYLDKSLEKESFLSFEKKEDADSPEYAKVQEKMQAVRETSHLRYLYTAKKTADGSYIYLVDGLSEESSDFRYPGDIIEPENIPDIEKAYKGETVLPKKILNTSWGKIFLAYYPIHQYSDGTGNVIGVVGMEFDAQSQYNTYENLKLFTPAVILLICIVAFFISSKRFRRISNPKSKDLYNTDQLTKLKSRNAFEYDIRNLWATGRQKNLGIFVMDIDYLKKVNDTCGHVIGDRYIESTAHAVSESLEKDMWAYRIGGDEFAVMMADASGERMEQWLEKFESLFLAQVGKMISEASISVGRAIYNENEDENLYDAYRRADEAMYVNKHSKKRRE